MNKDKFKNIFTNPTTKKVGICALVVASLGGSFLAGREVGITYPETYKYYSGREKIATVNGEELSSNNFKASMNIYFHLNKDTRMTKEEISEYEASLIEYNALTKALYDAGIKAEIEPNEETIQSNYDDTMNQLSQLLNLEIDEILKKFNLTEEGIKETLKQEYVANEYIAQESVVTEDDAKKHYDENKEEYYTYKASHILISTVDAEGVSLGDEAKAEAKQKAEKLLKEIKNGANFEKLAQENSDDGSAEDGGDLGYFGKGEMVSEFEEAVKNTEIGQLHPEIVETEYGYHIVKRTGGEYQSFEEIKDSLTSELSYTKQTELLEKVQEEANIKVYYK